MIPPINTNPTSTPETVHGLLTIAREGEETVLDVTGPAGDRKVTVERRRLNAEPPRKPDRAETPPRAHVFHSAKSMGDYLARYGGETTVVFADAQGRALHAVVDEVAADGVEHLTMQPQVHDLWRPWGEVVGRTVSLETFRKLVTMNRRALVTPDGRELAFELNQINASAHVEVYHGRGKGATNGIKVTTEIQGQRHGEDIPLPDTLVLRVPLFVTDEPREIELDLAFYADREGNVAVAVSTGNVAEALVAAFEGMVKTVRDATAAKKAVVTFGVPAWADWRYLKRKSDEA